MFIAAKDYRADWLTTAIADYGDCGQSYNVRGERRVHRVCGDLQGNFSHDGRLFGLPKGKQRDLRKNIIHHTQPNHGMQPYYQLQASPATQIAMRFRTGPAGRPASSLSVRGPWLTICSSYRGCTWMPDGAAVVFRNCDFGFRVLGFRSGIQGSGFMGPGGLGFEIQSEGVNRGTGF